MLGGGASQPVSSPTPSPSHSPSASNSDSSTTGSADQYLVSMVSGSWNSEISWKLDDGPTHPWTSSLPLTLAAGSHTLHLLDSFGDGWNGASWSLSSDGTTVAGPYTISYGSSEQETFMLGGGASQPVSSPTSVPTVTQTVPSHAPSLTPTAQKTQKGYRMDP